MREKQITIVQTEVVHLHCGSLTVFWKVWKSQWIRKWQLNFLKKGRTHVKGLYSRKKDIKFDADLVLGVEDGKARFSLEFSEKET